MPRTDNAVHLRHKGPAASVVYVLGKGLGFCIKIKKV